MDLESLENLGYGDLDIFKKMTIWSSNMHGSNMKKGGEVELSTLPSTWMRIHKIATEGVKWPKYPWWFLKIPNLSQFQKIILELSCDLVKLGVAMVPWWVWYPGWVVNKLLTVGFTINVKEFI